MGVLERRVHEARWGIGAPTIWGKARRSLEKAQRESVYVPDVREERWSQTPINIARSQVNSHELKGVKLHLSHFFGTARMTAHRSRLSRKAVGPVLVLAGPAWAEDWTREPPEFSSNLSYSVTLLFREIKAFGFFSSSCMRKKEIVLKHLPNRGRGHFFHHKPAWTILANMMQTFVVEREKSW